MLLAPRTSALIANRTCSMPQGEECFGACECGGGCIMNTGPMQHTNAQHPTGSCAPLHGDAFAAAAAAHRTRTGMRRGDAFACALARHARHVYGACRAAGRSGADERLVMSRTNAGLMGHSVPAGGVHAQVRLLWLLRLHARTRHTVRQHLDLQADGTRSRSGEWGRCGVR